MGTEADDLEAFKRAVATDIDNVDAAHDGAFAEQIRSLLALSANLETAGTIAVIPTADYSKLLGAVESASALNISQADLASQIRQLGANAVAIASKVPGLLP